MVVQREGMRVVRDRAAVGRDLTVVLAAVFQRQLERADGDALEADVADLRLDLRIEQRNRAARADPGIGAAQVRQQPPEILVVERPRQAFPAQHRVGQQRRVDPAVGEHVGEVQLAAGLEHPEHLGQDPALVAGQVEHAVGDHHVDAGVR